MRKMHIEERMSFRMAWKKNQRQEEKRNTQILEGLERGKGGNFKAQMLELAEEDEKRRKRL